MQAVAEYPVSRSDASAFWWSVQKVAVSEQQVPKGLARLRQWATGWVDPLRALLSIDLISTTPYTQPSMGGTTDVSTDVEYLLERIGANSVRIPAAHEVRDYLLRYPDISDALLEACVSAKRHFGLQTQLSLELYLDPEIRDEYLTLYVRQHEYRTDLVVELDSVWSDIEGLLSGKSGWLLITTDFREPVN